MNASEWWHSGDAMHAFARAAIEKDHFTTPTEVLDFFGAPWKWTPEYEHLQKHPNGDIIPVGDCETCTAGEPPEAEDE